MLNLIAPLLLSGMTVEVLGTVVGTAIQGQIVGGAIAPCNPTEFDVLDDQNSSQTFSGVNKTVISLDETVRLRALQLEFQSSTVSTLWKTPYQA